MLFDPNLMTQVAKTNLYREVLPAQVDRKALDSYLAGVSSAVGFAMSRWQMQASLLDVMINGPVASGGRFSGPPIDGLIRSLAPGGWDVYTQAICAALHDQVKAFEGEVRVPGMPWYPSFAAFPAPFAPPTPNVPCPMMALAAGAARHVSTASIKAAILARFGPRKPPAADAVATAVAEGFEKTFTSWLARTVVQLVMGSGPVPTYAPPYVPTGPVVNGRGNMMPGQLV